MINEKKIILGWSNPLTLRGNINIIKMMVMPQFNYVSGMVPVPMPHQI